MKSRNKTRSPRLSRKNSLLSTPFPRICISVSYRQDVFLSGLVLYLLALADISPHKPTVCVWCIVQHCGTSVTANSSCRDLSSISISAWPTKNQYRHFPFTPLPLPGNFLDLASILGYVLRSVFVFLVLLPASVFSQAKPHISTLPMPHVICHTPYPILPRPYLSTDTDRTRLGAQSASLSRSDSIKQ